MIGDVCHGIDPAEPGTNQDSLGVILLFPATFDVAVRFINAAVQKNSFSRGPQSTVRSRSYTSHVSRCTCRCQLCGQALLVCVSVVLCVFGGSMSVLVVIDTALFRLRFRVGRAVEADEMGSCSRQGISTKRVLPSVSLVCSLTICWSDEITGVGK